VSVHTVSARPVTRLPARALMGLIRVYQAAVSPLLPASCRFTPTCSQYAFESINRFGVIRGGWKALRRVLRCHPFHPGGYDPVDPV
jgi:uncharacterized protein